MKRLSVLGVALAATCAAGLAGVAADAAPSVYPTGTTIYDPDRAWGGYVVFHTPGDQGAVLIDMNGRELRRWQDFLSFSSGGSTQLHRVWIAVVAVELQVWLKHHLDAT